MELESLSVLEHDISVNVGELGRKILEAKWNAVSEMGSAFPFSPAGGATSSKWASGSTNLYYEQERKVCGLASTTSVLEILSERTYEALLGSKAFFAEQENELSHNKDPSTSWAIVPTEVNTHVEVVEVEDVWYSRGSGGCLVFAVL
jgi:hypothetical protein